MNIFSLVIFIGTTIITICVIALLIFSLLKLKKETEENKKTYKVIFIFMCVFLGIIISCWIWRISNFMCLPKVVITSEYVSFQNDMYKESMDIEYPSNTKTVGIIDLDRSDLDYLKYQGVLELSNDSSKISRFLTYIFSNPIVWADKEDIEVENIYINGFMNMYHYKKVK